MQELERLAVGLDAVLLHVFDKVAVGIATKTSVRIVLDFYQMILRRHQNLVLTLSS